MPTAGEGLEVTTDDAGCGLWLKGWAGGRDRCDLGLLWTATLLVIFDEFAIEEERERRDLFIVVKHKGR